MDLILKAREMGKGIQESEEYTRFVQARIANDGDAELQEMINQFNLYKIQLNEAMQKEARDEEKLHEIDGNLKAVYKDIMDNKNMAEFNEAKNGIDEMMNNISSILMMCVNGEDPDNCDLSACTGSCSTCGGCH